MHPKLVVLVPFDIGTPLSIPKEVTDIPVREAFAWATATALLGPKGCVRTRSEASEYVELDEENEHATFPYGTYAILGPSLRLWTTAGDLINAWKNDVTLLAISKTCPKIDNPGEAAALLTQVEGWQIAVDAFGCGAACLRLQLDLDCSAVHHLVACVTLLEYAIYGDTRRDGPTDQPNRRGARIDGANRCLARLRDFIACEFGDRDCSRALLRDSRCQRPVGIPLRWATHVFVMGRHQSPPDGVGKYLDDRRHRIAGLSALLEIEDEDLYYRDDTWISSIFVTDSDTFFRLLYVITVADVAAFLAIITSDMIDAKLMAALKSPLPDKSKAGDLRDVRLYAQMCVGLTATWRISAYDIDIAVVASRAVESRLDDYRRQMSASAETLYALESARYTEQQHNKSDGFVAAATIISLVSIWTLVLALKDTDEFLKHVPGHMNHMPGVVPDALPDFIIFTVVVALISILYIFRLPRIFWRFLDRFGE